MKKVLKIFVQGLIVFIPLVITGVVLVRLFKFFEKMFSFIGFTENDTLNSVYGLLLTVTAVCLIGLLASSYFFSQIFSVIEDKLEHAPVIRHIYSPVKDFTNAFMGSNKKFNKPVMVLTNPSAGIWEIGFITRESMDEFDMQEMVGVYIPMSYSLSGRFIMVSAAQIKKINRDPREVMKYVVSGGVTDMDGD